MKYQVLITGACGSIGQKLVNFLLEENIKIIAIDRCINFPNKISEKSKSLFNFISGDLLTVLSKVEEIISPVIENTQTFVIHLAGKSHAGECQKNPYSAFVANVVLTTNILEFCRKNTIKKIIFSSTGLVYGTVNRKPVQENFCLNPESIYATTKLAAENIIKGYSENYGIKSIICRFSNIYGLHGNPDSVVQSILSQIFKNEKRIIFRTGSPVRDFIYIDDVIKALYALLLFQMKNQYEIFNVSTGIGTSIYQMADTACKIAGISSERIQETYNDLKNSYLVLDNQYIKNTTGWQPEYSLKDGLLKIINKMR